MEAYSISSFNRTKPYQNEAGRVGTGGAAGSKMCLTILSAGPRFCVGEGVAGQK